MKLLFVSSLDTHSTIKLPIYMSLQRLVRRMSIWPSCFRERAYIPSLRIEIRLYVLIGIQAFHQFNVSKTNLAYKGFGCLICESIFSAWTLVKVIIRFWFTKATSTDCSCLGREGIYCKNVTFKCPKCGYVVNRHYERKTMEARYPNTWILEGVQQPNGKPLTEMSKFEREIIKARLENG